MIVFHCNKSRTLTVKVIQDTMEAFRRNDLRGWIWALNLFELGHAQILNTYSDIPIVIFHDSIPKGEIHLLDQLGKVVAKIVDIVYDHPEENLPYRRIK
jgi:hypothetical protein